MRLEDIEGITKEEVEYIRFICEAVKAQKVNLEDIKNNACN